MTSEVYFIGAITVIVAVVSRHSSQAMSGPVRQQSVSLGPFTLYKNRQGGLPRHSLHPERETRAGSSGV